MAVAVPGEVVGPLVRVVQALEETGVLVAPPKAGAGPAPGCQGGVGGEPGLQRGLRSGPGSLSVPASLKRVLPSSPPASRPRRV